MPVYPLVCLLSCSERLYLSDSIIVIVQFSPELTRQQEIATWRSLLHYAHGSLSRSLFIRLISTWAM